MTSALLRHMTQIKCPSCSQLLSVVDSSRGKRAQCPRCKTILQVPDVVAAPILPRPSPVSTAVLAGPPNFPDMTLPPAAIELTHQAVRLDPLCFGDAEGQAAAPALSDPFVVARGEDDSRTITPRCAARGPDTATRVFVAGGVLLLAFGINICGSALLLDAPGVPQANRFGRLLGIAVIAMLVLLGHGLVFAGSFAIRLQLLRPLAWVGNIALLILAEIAVLLTALGTLALLMSITPTSGRSGPAAFLILQIVLLGVGGTLGIFACYDAFQYLLRKIRRNDRDEVEPEPRERRQIITTAGWVTSAARLHSFAALVAIGLPILDAIDNRFAPPRSLIAIQTTVLAFASVLVYGNLLIFVFMGANALRNRQHRPLAYVGSSLLLFLSVLALLFVFGVALMYLVGLGNPNPGFGNSSRILLPFILYLLLLTAAGLLGMLGGITALMLQFRRRLIH